MICLFCAFHNLIMASFRFMRILVFFDLEMKTTDNVKEYTKFRKYLINEGFIMFQYSIYTKLVLNAPSANLYINKVRKQVPNNGFVSILKITENQFAKMEYVSGCDQNNIEDSTKRVLIF